MLPRALLSWSNAGVLWWLILCCRSCGPRTREVGSAGTVSCWAKQPWVLFYFVNQTVFSFHAVSYSPCKCPCYSEYPVINENARMAPTKHALSSRVFAVALTLSLVQLWHSYHGQGAWQDGLNDFRCEIFVTIGCVCDCMHPHHTVLWELLLPWRLRLQSSFLPSLVTPRMHTCTFPKYSNLGDEVFFCGLAPCQNIRQNPLSFWGVLRG